jgi:hypothetical protein
MIVNNLNIKGVAVIPNKTDSPLIIDADAVLPFLSAKEPFQVVRRWYL